VLVEVDHSGDIELIEVAANALPLGGDGICRNGECSRHGGCSPVVRGPTLVARARQTTQFHDVHRGPTFEEIVERFGGHPARALGLDLDTEDGRAGWLVAAALGSGRSDPAASADAYRALVAADLGRPEALAGQTTERVAGLLGAAGVRNALGGAALLLRMSRTLAERHRGSLEGLAGEAGDLAELGTALVRLAPGFGRAGALHFLRPLRSQWPAARETPLDPAALAAARHLGWIAADADEEGEPGALAAALAARPDPPPLWDVEAALACLGRAACRRERPDRCPLEALCPRRGDASEALASRATSE
jgi:endonuclease III